MTTISDREAPPVRDAGHDALSVFLGDWRAQGQSYGGPDQSAEMPKSKPFAWTSTIKARWHTGEFFLIHDERAFSGGPFDTLAILGVDARTGHYFARTFENHGFYRHYELTREDRVWTFSGQSERARIEFSADGNTQTIVWEWRPNDGWLPLCDRTAIKQIMSPSGGEPPRSG
jgi:hypothetical protein